MWCEVWSEVQCEVKAVDWNEIYPTLDNGEADAAIASIRISAESLEKADFTTREVYGPTRYAALRLITCGGHYDRRTGYADNVIVYAHLVDWH